MTSWVEFAVNRYSYYGHENRVTEEEYEDRLKTCETCEDLVPDTVKCRNCPCVMPRKAQFRNFDCPKGKWPIDGSKTPVE